MTDARPPAVECAKRGESRRIGEGRGRLVWEVGGKQDKTRIKLAHDPSSNDTRAHLLILSEEDPR
jgi:hypothetical protein